MLSMASCDHNFKGLDNFKGNEVLMQSNISLFNHYAVNTDKQPIVTHFSISFSKNFLFLKSEDINKS